MKAPFQVFLLGMPGCGKSEVYRRLAERLVSEGLARDVLRIDDYPKVRACFEADDEEEEGAELNQNRDIQALLNGQMSVADYNARIEARGTGALVGGAIVAVGQYVPALATAAFLRAADPQTQATIHETLEGLSGGPPISASVGRLPIPATPGGIPAAQFGQGVMQWGRGSAAARERMASLTAEDYRRPPSPGQRQPLGAASMRMKWLATQPIPAQRAVPSS